MTWVPYHPSHDDYQLIGDCRRWIARCLNIGTRSYLLSEKEVEHAYQEAAEGNPVVLSFASHDFRDLKEDVNAVRNMLLKVGPNYPNVRFKYSESASAMREALSLPNIGKCTLDLTIETASQDAHKLIIRSDNPTFGPQPYLAIKTVTGDYYHDNLDFQVPMREWSYVFDEETFPIRAIEKIGVATNNAIGVTSVATFQTSNATTDYKYWNEYNVHVPDSGRP